MPNRLGTNVPTPTTPADHYDTQEIQVIGHGGLDKRLNLNICQQPWLCPFCHSCLPRFPAILFVIGCFSIRPPEKPITERSPSPLAIMPLSESFKISHIDAAL